MFEKKMIYGVATSSYQIEGAVSEGGRVPGIWDTYAQTKGNILGGDSGAVACDHYHRFREDVALMKELGVESYRFSISWPRIFSGPGEYNAEGMRFYRELVAELLRNEIMPAITLYHWDLPQWAMDRGGWLNRDCIGWFVEFCMKCYEELDAQTGMWITLNEPWCAGLLHTYMQQGAPGNLTMAQALEYTHNMMVAHGEAIRAYHRWGGRKPIGITLNMSTTRTEDGGFLSSLAAATRDGQLNRWFMDPLFKGAYPLDIVQVYLHNGVGFGFVRDGDLDVIAEPMDFIGVNYYSSATVGFDRSNLFLCRDVPSGLPKTSMGWDIDPQGLLDLFRFIGGYTELPIIVTENGSAWDDTVDADGRVHDTGRQEYLRQHLDIVNSARQMGIPVAGYYAWSLMDNFEWCQGYSKRFGLVYVDYETQKRIPKDSFYTYCAYMKKDWQRECEVNTYEPTNVSQ